MYEIWTVWHVPAFDETIVLDESGSYIEALIVIGIRKGLWFTFSEDSDGTEKSEEEDDLHDS